MDEVNTHFLRLILDEDYAKGYTKTLDHSHYQHKTLKNYLRRMSHKIKEYELLKKLSELSSYINPEIIQNKYRELIDLNSEFILFESDLLYLLMNHELGDYRSLGFKKDYVHHLIKRKMGEVSFYAEILRNKEEKLKEKIK